MFGRRAFSVAGPAAWNSLPDYLRDLSYPFFAGTCKLFYSRSTSVHSALEAYALHKSTTDTDTDKPSIVRSLFHSHVETQRFHKSFPPQTLFRLRGCLQRLMA